MENSKFLEYQKLWEETALDKKLSVVDSALVELSSYFGYDKKVVGNFMQNSTKILAREWEEFFEKQSMNKKTIVEFYNNTKNEIFELMNWHYTDLGGGPLQYVLACEIGKRNKSKSYLDYGSGVGTGGILFALNGFNVSLADISSTNLDFCKHRFGIRGLTANFIDLKKDSIGKKTYDIVTCFDVVEHAYDPAKILRSIYDCLKNDGLLILHATFKDTGNQPMHILRNRHIVNKLRAMGFSYRWDISQEFEKVLGRGVLALEKRNRKILINKLYFLYDSIPIAIKIRFSNGLKKVIKPWSRD